MQAGDARARRFAAMRRQIAPTGRSRRRLWRALAAALGAVGLIGGLLLWSGSRPEPVALIELRAGTVEAAIVTDAMVVRNERVYTAPVRGQVQRHAGEGERVRVGTPVAAIVHGGHPGAAAAPPLPVSEAALRQELEELNAGIYRLALEVAAARERGDAEAQASHQAELDRLGLRQWDLSRRLGQSDPPISIPAPPPGGRVEAEVTAASAGVVIYQVDGLEALLNPAAADAWKPSWFRSLTPAPRRTAEGETEAGEPLFKVVDSLSIGLLALVPESALPPDLSVGGRLQIHFPAWPGRLVSAAVNRVEREDGEALLHLTTQVFPGELTSLRRVRVTLLFARYSGMVVPRTALDSRDGKLGVWVYDHGDPYFVPVRLLGGNAEEAALETNLQPGTRLLRHPSRQMR